MASDFGGKVDLGGFDYEKLQELSRLLEDSATREKKAAEDVFNYKVRLLEEEVNRRQKVADDLAKMGLANIKKESEARIKAIKKEKAAELDKNRKKMGGASSAEYKAYKKQIDAEYKLREEKEKKLAEKKAKWAVKYEQDANKHAARDRTIQAAKEASNILFGKGNSFQQRKAALYNLTHGEDGKFSTQKLIEGLADLSKQFESQMDSIASKKSFIDTRLQGSKNKKMFGLGGGSYWDQMSWDITGIAGVSPYIKQETIANKVQELVGKGISYNVEQRAFLASISDRIANTFNATDGTLLRLVRIQQQDSTASRLGMESMITAFLNNMYETTEYLSDIASSVRSSLDEAESLMGAADAVALEYQVQKWMGSLYSVGMSSNSVQGIARAFGQLAAGDISGLTSGGMGNLMIMAANQAGLSMTDILADGLDASETNQLMESMVKYLQEIAISSADSRVVQQQIAKVYGLTASDLRAARNIGGTGAIASSNMSYQGGINRLYDMANTLYARTSMGEMMGNVWSNAQYSIASGMASNPVTYLMYKAATLLDNMTGGGTIPDVLALGSGVQLHTTIADIMRFGALSGGILSSIGSMISNLGAAGGFSGGGMLKALGISGYSKVARGGGYTGIATSGSSLSESGSYVGNSESSAVLEKTYDTADKEKEKVAPKEEDTFDIEKLYTADRGVAKIYDLLASIVNGTAAINVKRSDGLPWSSVATGGGL